MKDLNEYIDHTFLQAAGDEDAVRRLCREARKFKFASVCVNPAEVKLAAKLLKRSSVKVCTVVGFPLGQNTTAVKIVEGVQAIGDGAAELDLVVNVRLLKFAPPACLEELKGFVRSCREAKKDVVLKLIVECCYLTDAEKVAACKMAKAAGFDFVKTSTGFGTGGATVHDVKLMRRAVGRKMGVKAAGGVRTREVALALIAAGANRLGCSSSIQLVKPQGKHPRGTPR